MPEKQFTMVGLGEVLWDVLPDGRQPGGACANFAYAANQLGNHGIIMSRVGKDALGEELRQELNRKKFYHVYLQEDEIHSTGTVKVSLENGQPSYEIVENVAWDFIGMSEIWAGDVSHCEAICFGSLAQRGEVSRKTIQTFVRLAKGLKIFDVNLRQNYFSAEIIGESFQIADVVKLNHEELPIVAEMFEISAANQLETAKKLRETFDLKLICLTRGANGSLLLTENEHDENSGIKVKIADTIGAGDSFTAAMTHGILRGWSLRKINQFANKVGAFVASQTGAMPSFESLNL